VGEAVSHPVRGIAAGVDRKSALQSVVPGFVQQIANGNHARHPSSEEDQLASCSTLAQRFCHGIQFSSPMAQVMVGDAKVHRLQHGMAGKKSLVSRVPKIVFRWNLSQVLGSACTAGAQHYEEKMKGSAPSHGPNLGLTWPAIQIT